MCDWMGFKTLFIYIFNAKGALVPKDTLIVKKNCNGYTFSTRLSAMAFWCFGAKKYIIHKYGQKAHIKM